MADWTARLDPSTHIVRAWVDAIRPADGQPPEAALDRWLAAPDPSVVDAVHHLLGRVRAASDLASAGILDEAPLGGAVLQQLERRLLPELRDVDTLHAVVREVFRPQDAAWLASIPLDRWERLIEALGPWWGPAALPRPLALAVQVLAHRIAALGLRPVLLDRVPELGLEGSPFLAVSGQVVAALQKASDGVVGNEAVELDRCHRTLAECRRAVERLRAEKHVYGTSLELTALTFRMVGLVERLDHLLHLVDPAGERGRAVQAVVVGLIEAESQRGELLPLLRRHGDLWLFQVVEHAARKGQNYITRGAGEYGRFLRSSMVGGVFVAVFALLKVQLAGLSLSLAGQALAYSLDYAICFILLYLAGGTLATKQPALTAHTLAHAIDDSDQDARGFAETVAALVRSQLASVFGNVVVALPLAWVLAAVVSSVTGAPLVSGEKAAALLTSVDPFDWRTAWFAGIAGVFLFGAGLVSGWADNLLLFDRIPQRVAAHPRLTAWLGAERAQAFADGLSAKAGGILGNALLGFALGSAGVFGHVLGLPLDIRHIAFGSANVAFGLQAGGLVPWPELLALGGGIALIGGVNLVVSFGLALGMAAESRGLSLREDGRMLWAVGRHFVRAPWTFLIPTRSS